MLRDVEGLTRSDHILLAEYMKDCNPAATAQRLGRATISVRTRICKSPLREAIDRRLVAREKRLQMTGDEVLRELAKIGRANISDFLDDTGQVLPPTKWPEDKKAAISNYSKKIFVDKNGQEQHTTKLGTKKLEALTLLSKHLGLVTEHKDISIHATLALLPMDQLMLEAKKALQLYGKDPNVIEANEPLQLKAADEIKDS